MTEAEREIVLFDKLFVKTGELPVEMSKWLHKAFDLRQIGDYRELASLPEEQVEEVLKWAGEFVSRAEEYLARRGLPLTAPSG